MNLAMARLLVKTLTKKKLQGGFQWREASTLGKLVKKFGGKTNALRRARVTIKKDALKKNQGVLRKKRDLGSGPEYKPGL